jgi:hypothetical protein
MATNPFSGLGLSNVGNESKYFGKPTEVPGFIQGAIAVPAAYAAQNFLKPAVNWLESKLQPAVPPAVSPLGTSPAAPLPLVGSSVDVNADHPLLDGLTKSNPY